MIDVRPAEQSPDVPGLALTLDRGIGVRPTHATRLRAQAAQGGAPPGPVVCVRHKPHGDGVVGAREDLDLVPRADIGLLNESQVSTRGRCPCEPLRESGISHTDAQLEARDARRGHLEDRGPNAPTLADHGVRDIQVSDREVLAQCARGKGSSELTSPPVEVGEGIGVALRVRLT